MAWKVEIEQSAMSDLDQLDSPFGRKILKSLFQWLMFLENPRSIGRAFSGSNYGELWKYHVGDYRIVARIEDDWSRILALRITHRPGSPR